MERRYWPFDVIPPERQTERHRAEIRFFQGAHEKGYRPYVEGLCFGAAAEGGRNGLIVVRGLTVGRWEVILWAPNGTGLSAYLDDFDCAADAVLRWIDGDDAAAILEGIQTHLVVMSGTKRSFTVYPAEPDR